MNVQEILNNLAGLEKELRNIKSARVRVDETTASYRETQNEIAKLINGLGQVVTDLGLLTKELKVQDATLSERVKETVGKIEDELWAVNKTFEDNCEKPIASLRDFGRRILSAAEALQLRAILQALRNI